MKLPDEWRRVAIMVDYLFGRGVSSAVPKEGLRLVYSRKSGRVKLVLHNGVIFATVKPSGAMALSIHGARTLMKSRAFKENCVTVSDDAAPFVREGKSVFCKFVTLAGKNVTPRGETVVLDKRGRVIGVGTSLMRGEFIKQFISGVAVKTRQGAGT